MKWINLKKMKNNEFYLNFTEEFFVNNDIISENIKVTSKPKKCFKSLFYRIFYYITFCKFNNLIVSYKYKAIIFKNEK